MVLSIYSLFTIYLKTFFERSKVFSLLLPILPMVLYLINEVQIWKANYYVGTAILFVYIVCSMDSLLRRKSYTKLTLVLIVIFFSSTSLFDKSNIVSLLVLYIVINGLTIFLYKSADYKLLKFTANHLFFFLLLILFSVLNTQSVRIESFNQNNFLQKFYFLLYSMSFYLFYNYDLFNKYILVSKKYYILFLRYFLLPISFFVVSQKVINKSFFITNQYFISIFLCVLCFTYLSNEARNNWNINSFNFLSFNLFTCSLLCFYQSENNLCLFILFSLIIILQNILIDIVRNTDKLKKLGIYICLGLPLTPLFVLKCYLVLSGKEEVTFIGLVLFIVSFIPGACYRYFKDGSLNGKSISTETR